MAVVAVIDGSFAISASQVSLYDYTSEETVILTIIIVLLSVSILSLIEFTWNVGQHSSAHRRSHGDSWHQESLKQKKVIVENSVARHVRGILLQKITFTSDIYFFLVFNVLSIRLHISFY
jgi:hypothetical protein